MQRYTNIGDYCMQPVTMSYGQ